jgi:hypothetical protein
VEQFCTPWVIFFLFARQAFFNQSPTLFASVKKVVVLSLQNATAMQRLSLRRVHVASGRVYHLEHNPPKVLPRPALDSM